MDDRRQMYETYIKSDKWKLIRKQVLDFWGNRCILCYSDYNVHVHHRSYDRLGNEIMTDIIPLCAECHERHHWVIDELREDPYTQMIRTLEMLAKPRPPEDEIPF